MLNIHLLMGYEDRNRQSVRQGTEEERNTKEKNRQDKTLGGIWWGGIDMEAYIWKSVENNPVFGL